MTDLNFNWVNEFEEICFPNLAHNNFRGLERETSEGGKTKKTKQKTQQTEKPELRELTCSSVMLQRVLLSKNQLCNKRNSVLSRS